MSVAPPKSERHINVPLTAELHEALHVWSSRTREPARRLVEELLREKLEDLGILPKRMVTK